MRSDKQFATDMRKRGKSYAEIHAHLKIPKATLSDWFASVDWSRNIKEKLSKNLVIKSTVRLRELNRIRGQHLKNAYSEARNEAYNELKTLKYNPVFIAGLMLYWGEGDKRTNGQVRLVNTEPEMIRLFVFFLINICQIPSEKIRASVLIYPDLDSKKSIDYWSEQSGVKIENFGKCPVIQGKHKTRRLSYGVCNILVLSTYFKVKMLEWLKLLPKELMSETYYAKMGQ